MSRIGKKPIEIPEKTTVELKNRLFSVKGEKGTLEKEIHPAVDVKIENNIINVIPLTENRTSRAFQGMTRALIANMVTGVSKGFERVLEINGIGYRAEMSGNDTIVLNLGYSHPINYVLPQGISAAIEKNSIKLSGIDKESLGHTASSIRSLRPPEPYKGKGIKYKEEYIQKKAGKTGTK